MDGWAVLLGLVLVSAGVTAFSLCACALYGRGRDRRRLVLLLLLLAVVLGVRYGGGALLARLGLGWRLWPRGGMALCAAVLTFASLRQGGQLLDSLPVREGTRALIGLCGAAAALALAGLLLLGGLFSASEQVLLTEDGGTVTEYDGIFHVSVYRYVNPLIRGGLMYEWQD